VKRVSATTLLLRELAKDLADQGEVVTLEHRFSPPRRFRFDLALPAWRIALEVEGGVWTCGRHTRPRGFLADIEKYNMAAILGWRVVRCVPGDILVAGKKALYAALTSTTSP
jgi:hypothetical protein